MPLRRSFCKQRLWRLACPLFFTEICSSLPLPMSIDDERFITHFAGQETVPLEEATEYAGPSWNIYPGLDTQARIGTWIVPLFILIGCFQFPPLGFRSTIAATAHLISDPHGSLSSLLSKLATHHILHKMCQKLEIPDSAKKPLTMVLAAYEDWAECLLLLDESTCHEDIPKRLKEWIDDAAHSLEHLLRDDNLDSGRTCSIEYDSSDRPGQHRRCSDIQDHDCQIRLLERSKVSSHYGSRSPKDARISCIQVAAKELSDGRVNGLGKTVIGTSNYLVTLGLAFTHVINGDFNNRTGHSIAFSMLWSWLIVAVFLSSVVGGFKTKRTSRTILERLQRDLDVIEVEEIRQRWIVRRIEQIETRRTTSKRKGEVALCLKYAQVVAHSYQQDFGESVSPPIFRFHKQNSEKAYETLEWAGMNHSLNPSVLCPRRLKTLLYCATVVPIGISAASACWISTTSPTSGVGCRSIQQLSFFAAWACSSGVTELLRRRLQGKQRYKWTLYKDVFITLAMCSFFGMGFIGWFNSTMCWSAEFSRGDLAFIVVHPDSQIQALAGSTWPEITGTVLGLHLIFSALGIAIFWKATRLFAMSDEEHQAWCTPALRDWQSSFLPGSCKLAFDTPEEKPSEISPFYNTRTVESSKETTMEV